MQGTRRISTALPPIFERLSTRIEAAWSSNRTRLAERLTGTSWPISAQTRNTESWSAPTATPRDLIPAPELSLFYPTTGNFIAVVGKAGQGSLVCRIRQAMSGATVLPVESIAAPRFLPSVDFSDHVNYWNAGYPAVMITDKAFYRNPNHHPRRDTADTLDYPRMSRVVAGEVAPIV